MLVLLRSQSPPHRLRRDNRKLKFVFKSPLSRLQLYTKVTIVFKLVHKEYIRDKSVNKANQVVRQNFTHNRPIVFLTGHWQLTFMEFLVQYMSTLLKYLSYLNSDHSSPFNFRDAKTSLPFTTSIKSARAPVDLSTSPSNKSRFCFYSKEHIEVNLVLKYLDKESLVDYHSGSSKLPI
ncbi:hypothetical protein FF38_04794 [Lucilia cuprina]|uniref:Uncharacterized protein n=1 Tax=Lucilia cuprina TaxID=7375 RepID=A0A0L0BL44_LUCCU|nr:hypothetical protein FF38_04794 [Lucilia cuprina]